MLSILLKVKIVGTGPLLFPFLGRVLLHGRMVPEDPEHLSGSVVLVWDKVDYHSMQGVL